MNVRLELDYNFVAGFVFDNRFMMNNYYGTIHFTTNTESAYEQNIAVDRIKFFIDNAMEHSIMIHDQNQFRVNRFREAGVYVLELPESPYDQIVNIMLMSKFSAITEGRILVNDISLASECGGMVKFLLDFDEAIGPFAEDGWWHDPTISTVNKNTVPETDDSVVNIAQNRVVSWEMFGLGWTPPSEIDIDKANTDTVVVGKFNAPK
jgi:hypothetical protein